MVPHSTRLTVTTDHSQGIDKADEKEKIHLQLENQNWFEKGGVVNWIS